MIDYPDSTPEVGPIPGVPDDVLYVGDKLDRIALLLRTLVDGIAGRNTPAATIRAFPVGTDTRIPAYSVRQRLLYWIVCPSALAEVSLDVGTAEALRAQSNAETLIIPVEGAITIEPGQDVTLDGTILSSYLITRAEES